MNKEGIKDYLEQRFNVSVKVKNNTISFKMYDYVSDQGFNQLNELRKPIHSDTVSHLSIHPIKNKRLKVKVHLRIK